MNTTRATQNIARDLDVAEINRLLNLMPDHFVMALRIALPVLIEELCSPKRDDARPALKLRPGGRKGTRTQMTNSQ